MAEDTQKAVLKRMPYGFYAVTSRHGDEVNAMVANWLTQASFEPRLLVFGLQKTSYTHGLVENGRVFTVNIFQKEDEEAIKPFSKGRAKYPEKMQEATYTEAPETGCPVLEGASAYMEFRVVEILDIGGDHDIVVGELVNAESLKDGEVDDSLTLPYIGWSYAG